MSGKYKCNANQDKNENKNFTFLAPIFGVVVVDTVLVNSTKSLTLIKDWRLCIADDKE